MTTILTKSDLDARSFSADRLDALFAAVQIDDDVDAHTELPSRITLDHDESRLADCFRICRQLVVDQVDFGELDALLDQLRRERDLDAADRRRFKHIRARLKHFRFACALYGEGHRYPPVVNWMTTALGHVQDAMKVGQRTRVATKTLVAKMFLLPLPSIVLERERDKLALTSSAGFRGFATREIAKLAALVAVGSVTGAEFHDARKVASRQVAFYDTMRTIQPDDEYYRMSRSLAAINGLMGDMHDQLVLDRAAGVRDYHRERFELPGEIGTRIEALVDRYRTSGLRC